ncbi:c-type cytochrome [Arcobacter sp.]|uniref:c-type cytochrome n=1 Tax=Arcobacter sp. TaxID=1872629 RepID=UPI003D0ED8E6
MKKILLSSMVAVLIFNGCTEDKKEKQNIELKTEQSATQSNKNIEIIKEKSNDILNSSKEIVNAVKDETLKVVENSKDITNDVVAKAKEVSVDVAKEAKVITNNVAENITKSIDKVIETKNDSANDNAKALFIKCAGCHGQNGEIHALGKSQKINEWDEAKIENALLGYKNDTYGGNMKGVMKGQVMHLNEADIKALSKYISKMGK